MSNVKLQASASGTGTVTIAPPVTNSDLTINLPANSGTVPTIASVVNNGVVYTNSTGAITSSSALTFDGTNLGLQSATNAYAGSRNGATFRANSANGFEFILQSTNATAGTSTGFATAVTGNDVYFVNRLDGFYSWITGASGNTEQMRLTSTGLGVGTSTPAALLHLSSGGGTKAIWATTRNFTVNRNWLIAVDEFAEGTWTLTPSTTLGGNTYTTPVLMATVAGNLGLGVTPSAWSVLRAVQIPGGSLAGLDSAGNRQINVLGNSYFDGSNFRYIGTDPASRYTQNSGVHYWFTAPSGTAGNAISFTQAMTLDASGNLGVGTTTIGSRVTIGDPGTGLSFTNAASGNFNIGLLAGTGSQLAYIFQRANSDLIFGTNNTERARITSGGDLGIGTSSPGAKVEIYGTGEVLRLDSTAGQSKSIYLRNVGAGTAKIFTDGTLTLETNASYPITFSTGLTERARITSGGYLLLGTTSTNPSSGGLAFGDTSALGGAGWGVITSATSTSSSYVGYFKNPNGAVGSIIVSGTTTSYNTVSDYRLKENIQPMTGALAKVAALKPCIYTWKADGSDGEGFIAHELAEVCPQAVTGDKDAMDADGNPKYQGIDTSFLVATLTAAIKELKAEFDAYKATHP